jgi:arsenite transporter
MSPTVETFPASYPVKRLNPFERYLSVWVALCMVTGIALGRLLPGLTDALRVLFPQPNTKLV